MFHGNIDGAIQVVATVHTYFLRASEAPPQILELPVERLRIHVVRDRDPHDCHSTVSRDEPPVHQGVMDRGLTQRLDLIRKNRHRWHQGPNLESSSSAFDESPRREAHHVDSRARETARRAAQICELGQRHGVPDRVRVRSFEGNRIVVPFRVSPAELAVFLDDWVGCGKVAFQQGPHRDAFPHAPRKRHRDQQDDQDGRSRCVQRGVNDSLHRNSG